MEFPGHIGGQRVGEAEKDYGFVSIHELAAPIHLLGLGLRLTSLCGLTSELLES